jgi:hypothetical protein
MGDLQFNGANVKSFSEVNGPPVVSVPKESFKETKKRSKSKNKDGDDSAFEEIN